MCGDATEAGPSCGYKEPTMYLDPRKIACPSLAPVKNSSIDLKF